MQLEEEPNQEQLALKVLSFEDRLTFAKALKRSIEKTDNLEEKRKIKTQIRRLFTDEEWQKLIRDNQN